MRGSRRRRQDREIDLVAAGVNLRRLLHCYLGLPLPQPDLVGERPKSTQSWNPSPQLVELAVDEVAEGTHLDVGAILAVEPTR